MWPSIKKLLHGQVGCLADLKSATALDRETIRKGAVPANDEFARFMGEFPNKGRAVTRMAVDKRYFGEETYLQQQFRADWAGTQRDLKLFAARFNLRLRKMGIPTYVHCARRTPAQQRQLYKEGRSKVKGPKAAHTTGCAIDIVHSRFHWQMGPEEWQVMGIVGKRVARSLDLDVVWGGDWGWDFAHWELERWKGHDVIPDSVLPDRYSPHQLLRFE